MATIDQKRFHAREIRVVILIIIGVLLLIYGIYRVGKIFDVFADRYTLVTLVPSAAGLREGATVALAGQQIGQVDGIEFIPMREKRDGNHLRIKLQVAKRIQQQVRANSKVVIRPQGLLGDKYIDIQPGTLATVMLEDNDTIQAETALDMDQFLARATEAMDQTVLVVQDLGRITAPLARGKGTMGQLLHDEQLYKHMVSTTTEMQQLLAEINRGDGALGRLVRDPALYNRMVSAMTRIDQIGGQILNGNGTLSKLISSDSLYRGLAGTAARADVAAGELSTMLQRLNRPEGTMNKLMTDPRLFDELLKSVIDLQTLLKDVRENPKKYAPPINVKVF
jgi:phospholipid/cholesterol/gamma-HCH transport system substrate-binding protein